MSLYVGERNAVLQNMLREVTTETVIFEWHHEVREWTNQVSWGKSIAETGNSKCKGPEAVWLASASGRSVWLESCNYGGEG